MEITRELGVITIKMNKIAVRLFFSYMRLVNRLILKLTFAMTHPRYLRIYLAWQCLLLNC